MRKTMTAICGTALLGASMSVTSAGFDGSVPMLCAVTDTVSCDSKGECVEGSAEAVKRLTITYLQFAQPLLWFR